MHTPFTKIDHVQLAMPAGGEAAARQFYVGTLGMAEVAKPAALAARDGAWFKSGRVALHLGVEADFCPARKAHPALCCHNYAALLARLRQGSIEVIEDDAIPGVRRCYVRDPFGNRLELIDASGESTSGE